MVQLGRGKGQWWVYWILVNIVSENADDICISSL